jgi:hypothetical protein
LFAAAAQPHHALRGFQVAVIVATGGSIPIFAAKAATSTSAFMPAVPQGRKATDLIYVRFDPLC